MPELSADKVIGSTLYAKKKLIKLNTLLEPIGTIEAGQLVGVVYSYIQRDGFVYWMFQKPFGSGYFLVKHTADSFKFSGDVAQAVKVEEAKKEQQIIDAKGKVPYYIEKYGKFFLLAVLGVTIINTIIKSRK